MILKYHLRHYLAFQVERFMKPVLVLASSLAFCLAGDGDTFDQLQVAYGNFPMENSVHKAPVTIESGEIPDWLSGTGIYIMKLKA